MTAQKPCRLRRSVRRSTIACSLGLRTHRGSARRPLEPIIRPRHHAGRALKGCNLLARDHPERARAYRSAIKKAPAMGFARTIGVRASAAPDRRPNVSMATKSPCGVRRSSSSLSRRFTRAGISTASLGSAGGVCEIGSTVTTRSPSSCAVTRMTAHGRSFTPSSCCGCWRERS
jgi:hypothetical protein